MKVIVLALALFAAPAAALDVVIASPPAGEPVFGSVEVVFEVYPAEELERAELLVDDTLVATFEGPPFRATVDVGQENAEHRFEILATGRSGEEARAILVTPALRVDEVVDLDLQQLYVTVTRGGESVLDLEREAFRVEDDGERQEIVTFERGDVPIAALLLVDASESMRGAELEAAIAGVRAFAEGMAPLDRVKLVLFSDQVLHTTPFTDSAEELVAGLEGFEGRGSTALNDHLYLALELLEAEQGRRVVVLLSDGVDVASTLDMHQVLWSARRSRALVYWLRLGSGGMALSSAWRDPEGHREERQGLRRLVDESGGRLAKLSGAEDAPAAFAAILKELREQYVIGYYPSRELGVGEWHEVEVDVRGRGLEVRTREGWVERSP